MPEVVVMNADDEFPGMQVGIDMAGGKDSTVLFLFDEPQALGADFWESLDKWQGRSTQRPQPNIDMDRLRESEWHLSLPNGIKHPIGATPRRLWNEQNPNPTTEQCVQRQAELMAAMYRYRNELLPENPLWQEEFDAIGAMLRQRMMPLPNPTS